MDCTDTDKPIDSHIEVTDLAYETDKSISGQSTRPQTNYSEYLQDLQAKSSTPWVERVLKYIRHPFDKQRLGTPESEGLIVADFYKDGSLHCHHVSISDDLQLDTGSHGDSLVSSRLIISEDLSPRAIQQLGSAFNVPPEVFYDHLAIRDNDFGDSSGFDQKAFRVTSSQIRHAIASLDDTMSILIPCEMTASTTVRPEWEPCGYYNVYHAHEESRKQAGLGYLRPQWMSSFKYTTPHGHNANGREIPTGTMELLFESYKRITIHECNPSRCRVPTCKDKPLALIMEASC